MSVSVSLEQVNSVSNDAGQAVYQSQNTIGASSGLPLALFVFAVSDRAFSHVATTYDVETYPSSYADAITQGLEFYRLAQVTRTFSDIADAQAFALSVRTRLQQLCNDYPTAQDTFTGTTDYTFTTVE